MNIAVLVKTTFDTEEKVTLRDGRIDDDGVKYIVNPYDEYAIEEALRLREAHGGRVVAVSVGGERAGEALRTALAMGTDEAALIEDARLPEDEAAVARALAAYLRREPFDLVLGGFFAVDSGGGQVAIRTARQLGLPHVAAVTRLAIQGGVATALRDAEGDAETVEVALPALFTAQQGLNEPRYPSLAGIMKAKKKPFARLSLDDLELAAVDAAALTARVGLTLPPARAAGRLLKGEPRGTAAELAALLLSEAKLP